MMTDKVFTTRNFEGERRSIPLPIQTYFWRQTRYYFIKQFSFNVGDVPFEYKSSTFQEVPDLLSS